MKEGDKVRLINTHKWRDGEIVQINGLYGIIGEEGVITHIRDEPILPIVTTLLGISFYPDNLELINNYELW